MRALLTAVLVAAFATTTLGCKNKKEEAAKAQKQADDKKAEADKAQKEADDKAAEAKKAADEKLAKDRGDVRDAIKKDLDASDRKITSLKGKLAKAKGAKKKNGDAAYAEVEKRKEAVTADMAKIDAAAAADLDAIKTAAQGHIADLNKAVDNLEKSIK